MATNGTHPESSMLVDTSGDASELPRSSLDYLSSFVAAALQDAQHLGEIKRLKVTGKWISKTEETLRARASSHTRSESGASDSDTKLREPNGAVKEDWEIKTEKEWARGIKTLRKLVEKLPNLENLEWTTALPFSKKLWAVISPGLHELILDVSICSPQQAETYRRSAIFQQSHLKPLCGLRGLKSLRIQGMIESYQQIIWEAVFRNPSLDALDMRMAEEPMCRAQEGREPWKKIEESLMKTTGESGMDSNYRGYDGFGHLHHKDGHGEYLDVVAIRKARIAAGLVDSVDGGILPLRALRLEGFVVDALPFAQGFDNLERIDFLENCFDAGFALPESLREKVKVTKVKATGSREFSPEEVRQITEQVSELQVRTKSVPNLQKLAGLGMTRGQPIGLDKRPMLESRNSAAAVLKS